jgi:hypothetical protein
MPIGAEKRLPVCLNHWARPSFALFVWAGIKEMHPRPDVTPDRGPGFCYTGQHR